MSAGLDALIPFIKPLESLLIDPDVSDVMVNGDGSIHFERAGRLTTGNSKYPSGELAAAVKRIARIMGRDVNEMQPLLVTRLGDGSRVAIVGEPCSVGGASLAIRKFVFKPRSVDELVDNETLSQSHATMLIDAMKRRDSILICGQTSAGKSTLLNALTAYIPPEERIIVIEEVHELTLNRANVVYLETRMKTDDQKAVTVSELLREALWMRPDRIIVGEVRGAEAFDLLQALNTGHQGSLATIHANSPRMALDRLRSCVAMAGVDLAPRTFAGMIADVIGLVVQMERRGAKRVVTGIVRVEGFDPMNDSYRLEEMV